MEQVNKTILIEDWNNIRELVLMSIGTNKGSWWADSAFGSEIYLLKEKGKIDGKTASSFQRMLQECLAWLVQDGIVKKINCVVERTGKNQLSYSIEIFKTDIDSFTIKEVWNGV
jgi:phage gp46-like protein